MSDKLLNTAHYWAGQIGIGDKQLRAALEGVEPDGQRGESQPTYLLATVFTALMNFSELDGAQERARKDKESADKLALENAQTRGELCNVDEVSDWYRGHVDRANARFLNIPDVLGQFCDPRTALIVVPESRRLIHEAIAELAADSTKGGAKNIGGVGAPAHVNGERMGGSEPKTVERKQRRTRPMEN